MENKLELAPLPAEAKIEFIGSCESLGWDPTVEKSPAANLFLQVFTVDLKKLETLAFATGSYMYGVQEFLAATRSFYMMTRTHRNQRTQLNLYPGYPEYMEYIRYYCQALMDTLIDQIQDETGEAADRTCSYIKRTRQLIRIKRRQALRAGRGRKRG